VRRQKKATREGCEAEDRKKNRAEKKGCSSRSIFRQRRDRHSARASLGAGAAPKEEGPGRRGGRPVWRSSGIVPRRRIEFRKRRRADRGRPGVEAEAISGVENAPDADEGEIHTTSVRKTNPLPKTRKNQDVATKSLPPIFSRVRRFRGASTNVKAGIREGSSRDVRSVRVPEIEVSCAS